MTSEKRLKLMLENLRSCPINEDCLTDARQVLMDYMKAYPYEGSATKRNAERRSYWQDIKDLFVVQRFAPAYTFAMLVIFIFSGAGTIFASKASLPGDLLYPVKIQGDNFNISMTRNEDEKFSLREKVIDARINEISALAKPGQGEKSGDAEKTARGISQAMENINSQVNAIRTKADEFEARGEDVKCVEMYNKLRKDSWALKAALEDRMGEGSGKLKSEVLKALNAAERIEREADEELGYYSSKHSSKIAATLAQWSAIK
ncbi:MAG: DUF5667 domain-containing protein [Patescibacteria group bacterium]